MNRNCAWTDVVDNSVAESGRENQGRGGQFDEFLPQARKSGTVVQQGTACAGSDPQMVTDSAPLRFGFAEHQDANISLLIVIHHEALPLARSSHVCLLIRYPRAPAGRMTSFNPAMLAYALSLSCTFLC